MTKIAYKVSTPTLAYISTESITLSDAVAAYTIEELGRNYDRARLEGNLKERFFAACKERGIEKEGEDCWWTRKCVIDADNSDISISVRKASLPTYISAITFQRDVITTTRMI